MADSDPQLLVSTDWLEAHLNAPDVRILDGSYYLPDAGRDARAEYEQRHISGARFFDIDDVADARSELPHMVPPVEKFVSRVRAMGIGDGHRVIVYDQQGCSRPPASGGCSAISASATSRCWTAACRNGWPRAAR